MEAAGQAANTEVLAPITANQRIQALDVVRGFALIGIFMMNIEFFQRVMGGIGSGMPIGLTGIDWAASYFVAYFVQGKFWTIFSLLFGMGFAVMLTRAERAGRPFVATYLRRILALAVIGAVHYIFIWEGDILFSYAVAAGALMILLYGRAKFILIGMAVCIVAGIVSSAGQFYGVAGGLAFVALVSLYLRNEKLVNIRGLKLPIIALILLGIGIAMTVAAIVFWLVPSLPKDPRLSMSVFGPVFILLGTLAAKYHQPVEKRPVRLAVTLYMFMAVSMTLGGLIQHFTPPEPDVVVTAPDKAVKTEAAAAAPTIGSAKEAKADAPAAVVAEAKVEAKPDAKAKVDAKADEKKVEKTPAQKAAERKAERAKQLADRAEREKEETRVFTKGSYYEAIEWRARKFLGKAAGDAGFATVLIGMFLLGSWFVRSGIMENTGAHLPFFRKLATVALPLGIGLGIAGSFIATSHVPGDQYDGFSFAHGLTTIGNLPACLGYVGLVVLMLHSNSVFSKISVLAPVGRMALTNYLLQSLFCTFYFYGYGLGHWGMPRAQQLLFVAVFFILQIFFSHWWLSKFRYGPMEWLWRGFTYRQIPAFRIDSTMGGIPRPA